MAGFFLRELPQTKLADFRQTDGLKQLAPRTKTVSRLVLFELKLVQMALAHFQIKVAALLVRECLGRRKPFFIQRRGWTFTHPPWLQTKLLP